MTMEEAEAFFKQYRGNGYLMWHEDIPGEAAFRALDIPEETLQAWRQDILNEAVARAKTEASGGRAWLGLSGAIAILRDMRCAIQENYRMVIEAVDSAAAQGPAQRTIVLESIVGRTSSGDDGLLALTRSRMPELLDDVLRVADALADTLEEDVRQAPESPSSVSLPANPADFVPSFNPERAAKVVESYRSKARSLR